MAKSQRPVGMDKLSSSDPNCELDETIALHPMSATIVCGVGSVHNKATYVTANCKRFYVLINNSPLQITRLLRIMAKSTCAFVEF